MKFTLTEADCENIGIEFEAGLEVYPVNVGWVKCQSSKNKEKPKTQSTNSYYWGTNGKTYYRRYTNQNKVYGVKVIKVVE